MRPTPEESTTPAAVRVLASPAYRNRAGNPYNALLAEAVEQAGGRVTEFSTRRLAARTADLWHLHWPDHALHRAGVLGGAAGLARFALKVAIARLTRTRMVWTVHNAQPHEPRFPRLYRLLRGILLRNLDGWIALSDPARDEAVAAMPRLSRIPAAVIPHGHYRQSFPAPPDPAMARRTLRMDPASRVLLYFGEIRPYKNVPHLLRTFRSCPDPDLRLVVAGRASEVLAGQLHELAAPDPRIMLRLGFIPDHEVPTYFGAADLAVLPFSRLLNSGSAILSLSLDTPVLVPAIGTMPALHQQVGPRWVHLFTGSLSAADITAALAAAPVRGRAPIEHLGWDRIGQQTLDFYHQILRSRRPARPRPPARSAPTERRE